MNFALKRMYTHTDHGEYYVSYMKNPYMNIQYGLLYYTIYMVLLYSANITLEHMNSGDFSVFVSYSIKMAIIFVVMTKQ